MLILSSKLRISLLKQQVEFSTEDSFLVLPQCTMPSFVSNEQEWQKYFGNNGILSKKIKNILVSCGANNEHICFYDYIINKKALLSDYSHIVIPGGDAELGILRLIDSGLHEQMKHYSGDIIAYSAGALLLLKRFFLSPNYYYKSFSYHNGFGIAPSNCLIEVHYDGSELMNYYIRQAIRDLHQGVYAIGDEGAITIDADTGKTRTYGNVMWFS